MILSDNETNIDLINNESIAKTVVTLIKESGFQPLSIGIHGDWGAGKSSILEMISDEIDNTPAESSTSEGELCYACIKFNGWKHQGFEDSKIALMSSIVSELETLVAESEENKGPLNKVGERAKDYIKKLWKNINWMSVAKTGVKTAVGFATGTAPLMVLSSIPDILKSTLSDEDKIREVIDKVQSYFKEGKVNLDTSSNTEFKDFQENFENLLKEAHIKKLVILIDDLDRCLPEVAIDILEAVRLFMFTPRTAFVIAADESMIKYAVKKHFPDVVDADSVLYDGQNSNKSAVKQNISYTFADKYLEKLIQVPFRIPRLGSVEAELYIMLLMVGSRLPEDDEKYKALRDEALNRMKSPWSVRAFTVVDVQQILGEKYNDVSEEVLIATQICKQLAKHTDGNPRKIKRFINMLLLRYQIALNRGYGSEIKLPVLAKLMIAENYYNDFYRELPHHLGNDGRWVKETTETAQSEVVDELGNKALNSEGTDSKDRRASARAKVTAKDSSEESDSKFVDLTSAKSTSTLWYDKYFISDWLAEEPSLYDVDLRPYYFACKENEDLISSGGIDSALLELRDTLLSVEGVIRGKQDEIIELNDEYAGELFELVSEKIFQSGNFKEKPQGIDGLRVLTEYKPILRTKLVSFIKSIPLENTGLWIANGWEKAIPSECAEHQELVQYFHLNISNPKIGKVMQKALGVIQ